MAYKVLSSEKVFSGRIIEVVHDVLTMPDGKTAVREVVQRGEACAILPVTPEGDILFVRQYRHPAGGLMLEIPAGMLDEQEEPVDCARRELEEETGQKCGKLSFMMKMYPTIGFCTEVLHIFLAEELYAGEQNFDEDEFITLEKYPLEQAIQKIFSGEIVDSKTMVAILAYKEYKGLKE